MTRACPPVPRRNGPRHRNRSGTPCTTTGSTGSPTASVFSIEGGGRRIAVTYERGYPAAQLFAPQGDDLIGIEPMAAPTDALRRGGFRSAVAGKPETARFSIRVT